MIIEFLPIKTMVKQGEKIYICRSKYFPPIVRMIDKLKNNEADINVENFKKLDNNGENWKDVSDVYNDTILQADCVVEFIPHLERVILTEYAFNKKRQKKLPIKKSIYYCKEQYWADCPINY